MDIDWFTDTTAWAIGLIIYGLFMIMIWKFGTMFGTDWQMNHKIIISILGVPTCYAMSKVMLDRG